MKIQLLVLILALFSSKAVIADEYFQFVEFTCLPEAHSLKVRSEGFWNISAYPKESSTVKAIEEKSNLNYVDWKSPLNKTCTISGKTIGIELNYRQPSRGACGGEERAQLKVTIDGVTFIDRARFHSECFSYSVHSLDFGSLRYGSFNVCGRYTNSDTNNKKDVCSKVLLNKPTKPIDFEKLFKEASSKD